ncbi:MAG: Nif11-like leader peptide family natural product precursor [Myxococcota bacterium]|nr:Nif11-like leader peptide family natural product precursor [Myxococcota bacterium]
MSSEHAKAFRKAMTASMELQLEIKSAGGQDISLEEMVNLAHKHWYDCTPDEIQEILNHPQNFNDDAPRNRSGENRWCALGW